MESKIILSSLVLNLLVFSCGISSDNTKNKDAGDNNKELLEAEKKLLEQEKKLLELEKINLENSRLKLEEEKLKKNQTIKNNPNTNQNNYSDPISNNIYYGDAESTISNFLEAENSRDFESIYSFYSPFARRYFGHYNLSYSSLQKLYQKAWNSTLYSRNTLLSVDQISENEFNVQINYEWRKSNNTSTLNSKYDNLKFILDNENNIVEIYSLN